MEVDRQVLAGIGLAEPRCRGDREAIRVLPWAAASAARRSLTAASGAAVERVSRGVELVNEAGPHRVGRHDEYQADKANPKPACRAALCV